MAGIVQSSSVIDTGGTGATTLAFSNSNKAGNALLVVGVGLTSGKVFTVTDTQGNVYSSLTAIQDGSGTSETQLFFNFNCKAGANTVSFNANAAVSIALAIHEFTPIRNQSGSASANGTGGAINSGPLVAAGNLQFGFAGGVPAGTHASVGGTGWNLAEHTDGAPAVYVATEWRVGAVVSNATFTDALGKGSTLAWAAEIANFAAVLGGQTTFQSTTFTPQWPTW